MQKTPGGTAYETFGPVNAPAIVMIHGLGLCREVWQWQVPALAQNHRVITYDLFGHADSAVSDQTPSLSVFAAQLAGVLNACSVNKAALVGFSLGGMIARRFAMDFPDRVTALAILHSPHQRTKQAQQAILDRVEQARHSGSGATVDAALERWFTDSYRINNPDMMALVRRWVLANDINIYHKNYLVLADGIAEIVAPVPAIAAPTLVMTGDEDFGNGPDMTHAIAAEIPNAQALILKGLGHMALAEEPDKTTNALLSFFGQHLQNPGA